MLLLLLLLSCYCYSVMFILVLNIYRLRSFLAACRKEIMFVLTTCRKGTRARFPLQLTGASRLEDTTSANHLAASHNYIHPWLLLLLLLLLLA